jgi:SAM-dependent methyltransferase
MTDHDYKGRRIANNAKDILALKARQYCELGPGEKGRLSLMLHEAGSKVVAVEAPWAAELNKSWAADVGIRMYYQDFFTGDMSVIEEPVDCFVLAHCIAHFRFSPYILFQKLFDALPSGGHFYLSTVNATAYARVVSFMRGNPIVENVPKKVTKTYVDICLEWNRTGIRQIWDDWMHVKEYTRNEVETIMRNSGFEVVRSMHRNNTPEWTRAFWKKNLAIKFFPHLADEVIVIGRKP